MINPAEGAVVVVGVIGYLRRNYLLSHMRELGWVYQGRAPIIFPRMVFSEFGLNFILKFRLLD